MGNQITFYLGNDDLDKLDELANAAGKHRSGILRDIVGEFLKEPKVVNINLLTAEMAKLQDGTSNSLGPTDVCLSRFSCGG